MTTAPMLLKRLPANVREDTGVPVYIQIATILKGAIAAGTLSSGVLLPPERAMCDHFGVSRMTLREAYDLLEQDGLIERHRGRGTFVAPNRVHKQQQQLRSFTEEMLARGVQPSSRLLEFRRSRFSPAARQLFGLPDAEMAWLITRLRFGNGEPLAIETVEIPCYLCPNLDRFDLTASSLYSILEEQYGLDLVHCVEQVSAQLADRSQKQLLQIHGPAAVLVISRHTYSQNGTPVELASTVYRADRYSAVVHATRARRDALAAPKI